MFIQSQRISIRPFVGADLFDLCRLCSSAEAMQFIPPYFAAETRKQTVDRLRRYIEHQQEHGVSFGYAADADGRFIGRAGFYFIPEVNKYEIGYSLLPEYWGKGLATEITLALLTYAFQKLNLDSICARTIPGNHKSEKVLHKAGFSLLGERAFTIKNKLVLWNYYERENDRALDIAIQREKLTSVAEEWDHLFAESNN